MLLLVLKLIFSYCLDSALFGIFTARTDTGNAFLKYSEIKIICTL